jgi:RNA polymerase sigma-70 factor (ECF subfamily)
VASLDSPTAVLDPADAVAQNDRVRQALHLLGDADRDILLLTVWDDLDAASVAQVLGCSRAAVRVRLHRARRRLAALLDPDSPCSPQSHGITTLEEPA